MRTSYLFRLFGLTSLLISVGLAADEETDSAVDDVSVTVADAEQHSDERVSVKQHESSDFRLSLGFGRTIDA